MPQTVNEVVLTQGIETAIALSNRLGDVEHGGVKGVLREALIEGFLGGLLPEPFIVSSGVIVDSKGKQSGQCDVVVADASIFRPIYYARNTGLFALESVVATIEIKSRIQRDDIKQVIKFSKQIQEMSCLRNPTVEGFDPNHPYGVFECPFSILFGFRGQEVEDEGDRVVSVAAEMGVDIWQHLQAIIVPGKASAHWQGNQRFTTQPTPERREVRMAFSGLINSIKRLAHDRGHPNFGNYLVQE